MKIDKFFIKDLDISIQVNRQQNTIIYSQLIKTNNSYHIISSKDLVSLQKKCQLIDITPFKKCVFMYLSTLIRGETRSYLDCAISIGYPKSVRAVARVCATNRFPIIFPCHRIIKNNGSIGGYQFGSDIKASS